MSRQRSLRGKEMVRRNDEKKMVRRNDVKGMSRRRSLRGKEIADETVAVEDVKGSLPERLFATDRYPCERINMYSAIDNLRALETH
ncbi:hypothetical protein HID58_001376 [Brassica napus]|uniref:Uncharacterized protein n=2 Tax=Brassica TaxID=3705 RepID=A0ABQ8EJE6_BRANA|nr:hypothetical protein HID58_001376 [Brassica napus]CAG7887471.1 unnamed protein product [Brassica rapa]